LIEVKSPVFSYTTSKDDESELNRPNYFKNNLHFDIDNHVEDNVLFLYNEITYLP